ncbi:nuclear transport factor 2 family protein [Streptomyces kroppenstedtii]|uniref:nuclear transport factor 2 family protein n=1 Tax=Streptomyces kroppenstedtii TaxID=3051181 RepID=UPI0028D10CF0|nr:nuclear transport factor 2 family protein [Streptomyces sp. DSM 40484]
MSEAPHNAAVEAAVAGELRLLDPEVRRSPELVGALLHPDFHEFGASGRHWDRAAIIDMLATETETEPETEPVAAPVSAARAWRMRGVQLSPDVVHLTFDTERNGRRVHRSSLWRRSREAAGESWLLYFHQGTPFTV